jgi:peptidoglycan LD-endopeptidase CwlK
MASRNPDDLVQSARSRCQDWVQACKARGVDVLVYCTFRSAAEQDSLYAQGRTKPGPVVTWAKGGQSWHQARRAWDAVPMVNGKPLWGFGQDLEPWKVYVEEADKLGIEWAGRWDSFREYVHLQITDGLTLERALALIATLGLAND